MPIVDSNRLKGNAGAGLVAAVLEKKCLVRPVTADTDVGIDLYCETVERKQPHLHFWVQVKSGSSQCRVLSQSDQASCRFSRDMLAYWGRQPVPVLGALVPNPEVLHPDIYLIDITNYLIDNGLPQGKHQTLRSVTKLDSANLDFFLTNWVPLTTARLLGTRGFLAPIPTQHMSYEIHVPDIPIMAFGRAIHEQIRRTAAGTISAMHRQGLLNRHNLPFIRRMADIVKLFKDGHWESHMAVALAMHTEGRLVGAVREYGRARKSILGDPNVANKGGWTNTVRMIEEQIGKVRRGDEP